MRAPAAREDAEQKVVIEWANVLGHRVRELRLLYSITNGARVGLGQARKLVAMGVKKGVPDLHLPVARGGFHSLYVEMKRVRGGRVAPEQEQWHRDLEEQGNKVIVAKGAGEAITAIQDYLALK